MFILRNAGLRLDAALLRDEPGRRSDALREVGWLEQWDLRNTNRFASGEGPARARILIRLGDFDAAFVLIERELARPSRFSVHELRFAPEFDPIRKDPRYQALLRKYGNPVS
jgi:hypothetical protein